MVTLLLRQFANPVHKSERGFEVGELKSADDVMLVDDFPLRRIRQLLIDFSKRLPLQRRNSPSTGYAIAIGQHFMHSKTSVPLRNLERYIFVRNRRTASGAVFRLRRALIEVVAARRRRSARTASVIAAALASSAEQDQIVGHHFRHVFLLARGLVIPGTCLQPAFNVDFAAFFQVLAGDLRQPLPEHHVVPLRAVLPLAVFAFEALVGGQRDLRDRRPLRREFHFRILAKISNQNDFIYAFAGHIFGLLRDAHTSKTLTIAESDGGKLCRPLHQICDESGSFTRKIETTSGTR